MNAEVGAQPDAVRNNGSACTLARWMARTCAEVGRSRVNLPVTKRVLSRAWYIRMAEALGTRAGEVGTHVHALCERADDGRWVGVEPARAEDEPGEVDDNHAVVVVHW
jgi:hypothetical protein